MEATSSTAHESPRESSIELTTLTPSIDSSLHQRDDSPATDLPQNDSDLAPLVAHDALSHKGQHELHMTSQKCEFELLRTSHGQAVGRTAMLMLILSSVVILTGATLLAYLWIGQRNTATAGHLWRLIVLRSWTPQVVTTCTLALRWALAIQACLLTSMLASVAVENFEVVMSQVTAVSIMRATSAEPRELLWALLQGNMYMLWGVRTIMLTAILLLLQASFQFSSTILLSDIRAGRIRGDDSTKMIPYGQSGGLLSSDQASYAVDNPWGFKPPSWPAFAEYSEPPVQADVMIDTGFVVRAFLPYTLAQDRQSVGNFSGRATIIAARVACSQPTFSNLNLTIARDLGDQSFGVIKGDLELGEVPFEAMGGCTRRPCRGSQENPKKFECTLNFGDDRSTYPRSQHEWASTLCRVDEFKEQLMFSHKNGSYLGPGYLLLNVSQPAAWWWNIGKANNQSITDFDVSGDRFCTHLDTDTSYSVRLSATLCYYNPGPVQYDVAMQSNTGRIEPTVGWDAKQGQYDTGEVRKQLGVTENRLGYGDRGVLKLIKERDWPMYELKSMDLLGEPPSQNFALCQFCQRSNSTIAHRALAALFQDVLVETGNPALALQALFTTISQMTYYSLLVEFDQDGPAQVMYFITRLMPRRWTGFAVVVTLLAAHLCCGVLILISFLTRCQCSMLGQVWRCIAQVRSGDTDAVLKKAAVSTDGEISKWLKDYGKGETRVGILPWRRRKL